jgi:glycosyltransferase involved in cell wall biosynthesis
VVPPGDPQALATAIPQLLRNRPLLTELAANGRKFVEENYEWRQLVGKWVQDLEHAAANSTGNTNCADRNAFEQQSESL